MTPQTIWAEAQNRPTLVVRDLCARYPEVDRHATMWLERRRDA